MSTDMRFFRDSLGIIEVIQMSEIFGEKIPTYFNPKMQKTSTLDMVEVKIQKIGDDYIIIDSDTASWCGFNKYELKAYENLNKMAYKDFINMYSKNPYFLNFDNFIKPLYQRGLLKIDGKIGINKDIFKNGPLFIFNYLIEMLLTEKCNLSCKYCFADVENDKEDMPIHIGYKAIDEILKIPSDNVTIEFSGGEIFLNFKTLKKIVLYIVKKNYKINKDIRLIMQSNATLINDDIAAFIKEHNIRVGISLDGPKELNKYTRQYNNGKNAYENIVK
ncbi:MAG: radical SAM protein, partial [Candidatus Hodarchaeota archaeon]